MDQSPTAESERGLRADSALYLRLLLQWNVLRALFTAEALLHTSFPLGAMEAAGIMRQLSPSFPAMVGMRLPLSPAPDCTSLDGFVLCRATLAEAPRMFQLRQHLVAHVGAQRPQQTLDIPTQQKFSDWEISAHREPSVSPLPSKHTLCPTWVRIVGKCRQQMGGN